MDKPLVAAITGVVFGVTLTGAVMFVRNHTRGSHCQRATLVVQRTIIKPVPIVISSSHDEDDAPPRGSACPALLDDPLETDAQLSAAQTEYVNGNYACAQSLARKVATKSPQRAYRIIGATACRLEQYSTLKQVERYLDAPARQYLVYVCMRSGITRTKHGWKPVEE